MTDMSLSLGVVLSLHLGATLALIVASNRKAQARHRSIQRSFHEYYSRIEARLARPFVEYVPSGERKVWAIVFTFNRVEYLKILLSSMKKLEPAVKIIVVDNGSTDGTLELLTSFLQRGEINKLLCNRHAEVPQWQKSFNIHQAFRLLAVESVDYVCMVDDDVKIHSPWVDRALDVLETLHDVKAVSCVSDSTQEFFHPTVAKTEVGGMEVRIMESFNGQFFMMPVSVFREIGLPPIGEGCDGLALEDWYYSRQLYARGYRAAAVSCATHLGYENSIRERVAQEA